MRYRLDRIMQVNQPVVDERLFVLVPTQIAPGRIRDTDRPMKFGVLALSDDLSLDDVVNKDTARKQLLKQAIQSTYHGKLESRLKDSPAILGNLGRVV